MIPFSDSPRPDEEVAAGQILGITMGGVARRVPVLPIGPNRAFREAFGKATDEVLGRVPATQTIADVLRELGSAEDEMISLLVLYDRDGMLGGREYIEANAAPGEVVAALRSVAEAAFPFGVTLLRVPMVRATLMTALMEAISSASTSSSPQPITGRRPRSKRP